MIASDFVRGSFFALSMSKPYYLAICFSKLATLSAWLLAELLLSFLKAGTDWIPIGALLRLKALKPPYLELV